MNKFILLIVSFFCYVNNNLIAQYWSILGDGIGSSTNGIVYCLAEYNGALYAGGNFTSAGGVSIKGIAKWNGVNWSAVGGGLDRPGDPAGPTVYSLVVHDGELYAAGVFDNAGGITASNIAKWNGTNWSAVGDGLNDFVYSLAVYNDALYAAGLVGVVKWTGIAWTNVGTGLYPIIDFINILTVYNGSLYAAGDYGGYGGVPQYYDLAKFDGTNWTSLNPQINDRITTMIEYNDELYVGGRFTLAGSDSAKHIVKWNGTTWSIPTKQINISWGSGQCPIDFTDGTCASYFPISFVQSLAVYQGSLYAAGNFDSADTVNTKNIASWNGSNWCAMGQGTDNTVYAMANGDTSLYAGGIFTYVDGNIPVNKIAKWNDTCSLAPAQPIVINGSNSVCSGTTQTYSVDPVSGASSYTWNLPSGWIGNSTSNSITVTAGANGGIISVKANNICGCSIPQTLNVNVTSIPPSPSFIHGNDSICEGSVQTYFIDPAAGATGYEWTVPFDWYGYSTTDTISIIGYGYNDQLSVIAYNDCGSSTSQILPITVSLLPRTPDYIEGDTRVCIGTSHLYFIPPAQNAIDYTWELPAGWTGNSITDSLIVTAGNNSGTIYVKANNSCGSSYYQSIQISTDSIPSKPGNIIGDTYTYTNYWTYYSVEKVNGAKDYTWSAGEGIVERGLPRNYVSAIWKKAGTYELTVNAVNDCGISEQQKLTIRVYDFEPDDPFDINIYPNPSNGAFNLNAKKIQDKLIRIEVLTMSGQTIYSSGNRPGLNNYTQFIDLKKFPQGAYLVKIIIGDKVFTRTIIKNQ